MKNITLSADERLIEAARARARAQNTTLNELFRRWLSEMAQEGSRAERAARTIRDLQRHVRTGGKKFSRDTMNER
jgi:hypothetical protein